MTHLTRSGPGPAPSVAAESLRDRVRIPPVPAAVRHARQWAAAVLARAKPPVSGDLLDASVLVVSELVTNAISAVGQDRRPPGRAEVWLAICLAGRRVRIEVHDSACSPLPPPRPGEPEREAGRGMTVISALAADWGWKADPLGKVVWCELAGR